MASPLTHSQGITRRHDTYPFIIPGKYTSALKGKVVLVTGAGRGIGRATALAFASAGACVATLARTSTEINAVVAEIKSKYSTPAIAITGSILQEPKKIVAHVEEALGPIDILINNAGTSRISPLLDEENIDIWWNVFEVNVKGPMALTHALLPSFLARGSGTIIHVGSAAAETPMPFMSSYAGSKASLLRVVETLDIELRSKGIYNFYIHPGVVKTRLGDPISGDSANGEEMKEFLGSFEPYYIDTPELAANSMVALAGNPDATVLSGRYFDATEDLEELLVQKKKIEEGNFYNLRVTRMQ